MSTPSIYNGRAMFDEIAASGDVQHLDALARACLSWKNLGRLEDFEALVMSLSLMTEYTERMVRPGLDTLFYGTNHIEKPQVGKTFNRLPQDFHTWAADIKEARRFCTSFETFEPEFKNGCIGQSIVQGVILDVDYFTGALMEMPELPFNLEHGTSAWETGCMESEIITYRHSAPCRIIETNINHYPTPQSRTPAP